MKISHFATLALLASALLSLSGCNGEDATAKSSSAPPPANAPAPDAVIPGAAAPAAGAAAAPVPEVDPAVLAKQAKEEDAKLQARLKAGEVGSTPDPVMDPVQVMLETAYTSYFNAFQKAPSSVEDLVRAGYLRAVPRLPAGKKFKIDPNGAGITIE